MRLTRCHVDTALEPGATYALPEHARAHLSRVLRLRDGDRITLFNGDGHDYQAVLRGAGAGLAAAVESRQPPAATEAGLAVTLVQSLARGEKMDWIVQKATEIGVARIVPVSSQRSEVRLNEERADRRLAHWRKVAISACEQSGRAQVPLIDAPMSLHDAITRAAPAARFVLDPDGTAPECGAFRAGPLWLAIGPEGGFDSHELDAFRRNGWPGLRLGARILRTETAGIVALAAMFALSGEFSAPAAA